MAADHSSSRESQKVVVSNGEAAISLEEWRGWGTTSTVPSMVTQVVEDLNMLEKNVDAQMVFGGNHGKLSVKDLIPFFFFSICVSLVHSAFLFQINCNSTFKRLGVV